MDVPDEDYVLPLGKAEVVKEGKDVTVMAWGSMLQRSLKALEDTEGAEVIDLLTLSPFDEETVLSSTKKTGRVVIVHEAQKCCGLGAELAALISEEAILHLKGPILRVAGYDVVMPLPKLEDYYIPSEERIRKAVEEVLKY
jgi:pyruvate dehydrogenase E1 component beta subunit